MTLNEDHSTNNPREELEEETSATTGAHRYAESNTQGQVAPAEEHTDDLVDPEDFDEVDELIATAQAQHPGKHVSSTRFSRDDTGQVVTDESQTGMYIVNSDNPYLEAQNESYDEDFDIKFSKIERGFVSAGGFGTTQARTKRNKSHKLRNILLVLLFAAVIGVGYWAINRFMPISVRVNGQRRSYTRGITLGEIFADEKLSFLPGDFVSVSGEILSEDGGNPYSVTVNEEKIPFEDIAGYVANSKDVIEFADGDDVIEDYDVEIQETQPKLVMEGEWGAIAYIQSYGKVDRREIRTGKVSGEVAEGDILEEGSNCVIRVTNINPSDGRKLVALTFDDGPSINTAAYLDILDKYGIKATFFMLGTNIEDMPETAKMVADRGHQVATHTYNHTQLTAVPAEDVRNEISTGLDAISQTLGVQTTVLRPPYGEFRQTTWHETEGLVSVSVLWNTDSLDWSQPGVDKIVSNALTGISSGSIILMHDGGGTRDQDLEAIPKIIEDLQQQGYTFVTINELLASDESIPEEVSSGNMQMPEGAVWPEEIG